MHIQTLPKTIPAPSIAGTKVKKCKTAHNSTHNNYTDDNMNLFFLH